jgi:hypothetical protein
MSGIAVIGFFKGTQFPLMFHCDDIEKWEQLKMGWGVLFELCENKATTIRSAKRWMNKCEAHMKSIAMETTGTNKCPGKVAITKLCDIYGVDDIVLQAQWMNNIYVLLKNGNIKDDEMNGWMIINSAVASAMCG